MYKSQWYLIVENNFDKPLTIENRQQLTNNGYGQSWAEINQCWWTRVKTKVNKVKKK